MLELAAAKMPNAHLYQGDFSKGLAEPLRNRRYDFIIATYALHHLTDPQKVAFLSSLRGQLNEGGKLLIGDVAFKTSADLEQCRRDAGADWDPDEIYFVFDELKPFFPSLSFQQVSRCAGIMSLAP